MIKKIFEYSLKPYNIIFPFPLLPMIAGAFAGGINGLWKPVAFTFLFYPANNLWNHINDAEDDFKGGKNTPFINYVARRLGYVIVSILYLISTVFVLFLSKNRVAFFLFLLVLVVTFLYSDRTITGLRLKKHYLTEFLVYLIAVPSYIVLMYALVKNLDLNAMKIAVLFTPLMLSTLFLKDLKDISSDTEAGLKTFGVVFYYKTLIKVFYVFLLIYFLIGIIFFYMSTMLLAFIPVVGVVYSVFKMVVNDWNVTKATQKYIQYSIISGLSSLATMLIILIFLSLS